VVSIIIISITSCTAQQS